VRETAKRNLYTGKTYDSVDNIQQFFAERSKSAQPNVPGAQPGASVAQPNAARTQPNAARSQPGAPGPQPSSVGAQLNLAVTQPGASAAQPNAAVPKLSLPGPLSAPQSAARAVAPPPGKRGLRAGATVRHPKYGLGTILRREGDGEDAKLTISFQGYGLKKLVEKYAGIQEE
jgi:DNA helicase-2/ATP-dependent DNA helicase PcrA